jgi:hypothetical protein
MVDNSCTTSKNGSRGVVVDLDDWDDNDETCGCCETFRFVL